MMMGGLVERGRRRYGKGGSGRKKFSFHPYISSSMITTILKCWKMRRA